MKTRPEDRFHTIEQYGKTACFSCHGRPAKLVVCSRCRRVVYCNASCQKDDYTVHKHICKAWAEVRALHPASTFPVLDSFPHDGKQLSILSNFNHHNLFEPVIARLGDRAGLIVNTLTLNEPRCGRCLKVDEAAPGRKLEGCPDCVYRWQHNSQLAPEDGPFPLWCPDRVIRVDTPLPSDWQSYAKTVDMPSHGIEELERLFMQQSLSIPLTIVAAIERFGLRPTYSDRTNQRDLTVHLVGAELGYEIMQAGFVYEEISHLLPGVKRLRIVMVGPSMPPGLSSEEEQEGCPTCMGDGRSRVVERIRSPYHDYFVQAKPAAPDLVVGFNSGIHEDPESWIQTILLLLGTRFPVVFTSLNGTEASRDADLVAKAHLVGEEIFEGEVAGLNVDWEWREEENPWKTGRDHFDLFSPEGVWKENFYWMGFRGA